MALEKLDYKSHMNAHIDESSDFIPFGLFPEFK